MTELRNNASRLRREFDKLPRVMLPIRTKQKEMQLKGTAESTAPSCGRCSLLCLAVVVACVFVPVLLAFWVGVGIFHIGFDLN